MLASIMKNLPNKDWIKSIKIKEVWNTDSTNLVAKLTGKITDEGIVALWNAIDKSVEFNCKVGNSMKAHAKTPRAVQDGPAEAFTRRCNQKLKHFHGNDNRHGKPKGFYRDKFHWHSGRDVQRRRQLPPPPPMH